MTYELTQDPAYRELKQHAARYEGVTGRQGFLYPTAPGDGPTKFVFGTAVRLGLKAALAYARALGAYAEQQEKRAADAAARQAIYAQLEDMT